ncbi:MAG: methyltransferase domain-containing protein [Spirochaetes bacterium]|nr:methyltransferase domain-containing protein [Spirochaetota bacterium]
MPLTMNPLEKLYMLGMNAGPGPMLDVMGGFSFYAVSAAVRMGLFEKLGDDVLTPGELARALGCDGKGVIVLLEVLLAAGYVRVKGDAYRNSSMTRKWLLPSSPHDISDAFRYYHETMAELWPHIDESVRKGAPHIHFYEWLKERPGAAESYQRFMMKGSAMILPELSRALKLPKSCRSVIDVGGGHGAYAVAAAKKRDDIAVTVFDSAYSKDVAEKNIADNGLADRVRFVTGDYLADPLPGRCDAAFLFNVIHQHREGEIIALLKKIHEALDPGGALFLLDSFREMRMRGLGGAFVRLYGMVHFHFLGGDNHRYDEVLDWLREAGFGKVKKKKLLRSGMCLLRATR